MARKTNYGFEKRQKEIAKKAKKEEKKKKKLEEADGDQHGSADDASPDDSEE